EFARAIQPQHTEEVVDWLTKLFSSFSSSVTQAETSVQSPAVARVDKPGFLSTSIPAIAPTSAIEESAKLFDHSVSHLLLDDAQPLLDSDAGSEVEDDRNMSLERGRNTGRQIGIHVPQAAAYCQVVSSGNDEDGDDDNVVTDEIWVPDIAEEETEGGWHEERVESSHPIPLHSAAVISRPTPHSSVVWAFFSTSAADRTVAICKLCQRHIKCGKNTNHLGTTCITRHLTYNRSARWQEHLKATRKGHKSVPPPPPYPLQSAPAIPSHYLSAASTDKDEGIA
ncbi:hypothetical protein AB205_0129790, partial [Aquarana catesbeiana]